MNITKVKKALLYSTLTLTLSFTLAACGGGSDSSSSPTQPTQPKPTENSAPTINQFSVDTTTGFTVNYSWAVSDSNNDALSCVLSPGANLADITINDCKSTTTQQVTYTASGSFTAQLTVTDTSNATANKSLNVTVTDPNALPAPVVSVSIAVGVIP